MKKITLAILLLFVVQSAYAQTKQTGATNGMDQTGSNELKLNLLFTALGLPEITYERIINDASGLGASVLVGTTNDFDFKFGFTPYYRLYFGGRRANGFFIEGSLSAISATGTKYDVNNQLITSHVSFGVGAAVGAKFFTRNRFFGEVYLGAGRALGERYFYNSYPRFGISIGKRMN